MYIVCKLFWICHDKTTNIYGGDAGKREALSWVTSSWDSTDTRGDVKELFSKGIPECEVS